MNMWTRILWKPGLACAAALLMAALVSAQFPLHKSSNLRKKHLPYRTYKALGAKAIGVLVGDAQKVIGTEGRSGPPDQLCFSHDGCSYRWVYVPAMDKARITNLKVPVANGEKHTYLKLNMASPDTVRRFGIKNQFTLVEVEVNSSFGSPVNDSFVGTNFKVVEGSEKYPLRVSNVIDELRADYADYCKQQAGTIEAEINKIQKVALQNRKPTGPRQQSDLMYVTWMTDDDTLNVRFLSRITDGRFYYVQGGADIKPFPLPPRRGKGKIVPPPPAPPQKQGGAAPGGVKGFAPAKGALAPPPPPNFKVKAGTTFGIEFGRGYVVNKEGKILQTDNFGFDSFHQTIAPPPIPRPPIDPPPPPLPLPPVKQK